MLNKVQVRVVAGLFILMTITNVCKGSKTVYTIPVQMELYCVSANSVVLTNIARHLCVHRCMTADLCLGINYNQEEHKCVMAMEECSELQSNAQFDFQRLSTVCTSWVPYVRGEEYPMWMEYTGLYGPGVKKEGDLYAVGTFDRDTQSHVWGTFNGALITGTNSDMYDVLVVDPHCQVVWEDYSAGDAVPEGAVQAGYYGPGLDSYVIRMERGIYDPVYSSYRQGYNYTQFTGLVNITHFQLFIEK